MKQSSDVIYIVDAKMVLRAYNHAWINFAKNNDGRIILAKYSIGSRIVDSTSGPLRSFIISAYKKALYENKPFEHNFECSSANQYRLFRQTAYPLIDSKGLVISNHIVEECPHPEQAQAFRQQFINGQGFVTQCANCRRIRDPKNYHSWLWVPSLVENPFPNTSHGICPQCYDHYYPEIDDD